MSNQAFSLADDLTCGAGEVWFDRQSDCTDGWHHLGNADEMTIKVDVTTVEKKSSMNKKRVIMATATTETKATAELTLTEYNAFNLALGLYGRDVVTKQPAVTLTDEKYTVVTNPRNYYIS